MTAISSVTGTGLEALPERPRLRALDVQWTDHDGQPLLLLHDRLGIAPGTAFVPGVLGPLLALCDGSRDLRALRAAYAEQTGLRLATREIAELIRQLDQACLLEGARYEAACGQALAEYRAAPYRAPALAPHAYPADPAALTRRLRAYGERDAADALAPLARPVRGLVSPHIDYHRGGHVYSATWARAAEAVREAELVVVLGTDHCGGPGRITATRQHYATPFGILPTDQAAVGELAAALGEREAFAEELHHRNEHSIELALVWLHHTREGASCRILPLLCGSFHPYTEGRRDPMTEARFAAAVEALRRLASRQRTLFVAAADFAHVGPAFGDAERFDPSARGRLARADAELLSIVCAGDADRFFVQLRAERDARKVCGLPPIYLMLRALGGAAGEVIAYDQCPADEAGHSWVTIGGVLLH